MSHGVDDDLDLIDELLSDEEFLDELHNECIICGSRLTFGHCADHDKLEIEEIAHCHSCGNVEKKNNYTMN